MTDAVLFRRAGRTGVITLNRPQALHALNLDMCEAMIEALRSWRDDGAVELILLDHSGARGFCAGGDIRMLAESGAGDGSAAAAFFRREYQLNALLMSYPKPVAAFMDGVVMGGGVGLALPCRYRIATERTVFAMPESGIGLFPDVGGGWHLSRLPGEFGLWLALTGARIRAADCLSVGIATHVVPAAGLEAIKQDIMDGADVGAALASAATDPGPGEFAEHRSLIDEAFAADSVEGIMEALASQSGAFAKAQLDALTKKSPQTLKVAFRQLRGGRALGRFEDEMAVEFRIACRVVRRHDFIEGVRAVIIDKDNAPNWRPADLAGVDARLLDEIFAPLPAAEEWRPLEDA